MDALLQLLSVVDVLALKSLPHVVGHGWRAQRAVCQCLEQSEDGRNTELTHKQSVQRGPTSDNTNRDASDGTALVTGSTGYADSTKHAYGTENRLRLSNNHGE